MSKHKLAKCPFGIHFIFKKNAKTDDFFFQVAKAKIIRK